MKKFINILSMLFIASGVFAAKATFNITVPNENSAHLSTQMCLMVGNFNGWDVTNPVKCQKIDDTHYTITLDESTFVSENGVKVTLATLQYLYLNGPDWAYVMKNSDGSTINYLTYSGVSAQNDVVSYWASSGYECFYCFQHITIDFYAPKSVTECYVTGNFNGWKTPGFVGIIDSTSTKMILNTKKSDANGNYFTIKLFVVDVLSMAFIFVAGPSMEYAQKEGIFSLKDPYSNYQYFDGVNNPPQVTFAKVYNAPNRIQTFFNDSLQGKWILQENCILEAGFCDTIGKNTEYLIFQTITNKAYVKFTTNGNWNTSMGDSTLLNLPSSTAFGIVWSLNDFIFNNPPIEKIIIIINGNNSLSLIVDNFIGQSKYYKRDKTYNSYLPEYYSPYRIFPNPVKRNFILEGEIAESAQNAQVDVVSTDGRLLSRTMLAERGILKKQIEMPAVHAGLYFVLVRYDGQVKACLKICKE